MNPDVNALELLDIIHNDLTSAEIYVFTPKGEQRAIEKGATVLDFAYLIHTEVGNKAIAAKVNQRLVALNYVVKTGDQVEIIKAMNVLAGDATVDQLYSLDLVKTPADFYDLRESQLVMLEGWKERAAQRFLDSLRESRNVPFERVLFAIGIRYVGETTARDIARHFGDIDTLAQASKEELAAVPEVGEVIAESVYKYFRDERHLKEIERLKAAGLQMAVVRKAENASEALAGKTIVISGNFSPQAFRRPSLPPPPVTGPGICS